MVSCKNMREQMRQGEEIYRHIFESLNDAVFLADPETGRIVETNKRGATLLGRSRDEIVGMLQTELYPPARAIEYERMFIRHIEQGRAVDYDSEVIRKDGTIVPVMISASTLTGGGRRLILGIFDDVTERRQVEEALEKSEAKYRTLFEESMDAMYITSRDGTFLDANQSALNLLGYTREEILRLNARETYAYPSEQCEFQRMIEKEGAVKDCQVKLRRKDGKEIDCVLTSILQRGDDGRILGYQGTIRDVTEQKRADRILLRETEERFRRLSDVAFEGICIHENGIVLDAYQTYTQLFGYEKSEMIGKNALELIAPKYRNSVFKKMRSECEEPYEAVCIRKDGTTFPAEMLGKNAYYNGRKVRIAAIRDISERNRTQDELRESEERLRIMFESIMEGVIVYDLNGHIMQSNNAAVRLYGFQSKEELLGQNALDLIAKKDHARAKSNMKKRLESSIVHNVDYTCLRKDGTEFSAELSVGLMSDKVGKPIGYVAVIADVTQRKRLQEYMQFYITQSMKAQEEERKRIARELHDQTVQSLISLSYDIQAIKQQNELPDKVIKQLELLENKCTSTMEEVRQFSHELRPDILDRLGLVAALRVLTDNLSKLGILKCRVEVVGSVRLLEPETELELFRIVQEALRNVWKHAQATEVIVKVQFASDRVNLSVIDNGKGFEAHGQLSDLAAEGKLGLIGMQERARLFNGSLSVESQLGRGTAVTVVAHT